ncbi:MAG: NAD-dependent epimerase/dehydratase family protein [Bacteroidales bacterium]|jgi:UDP-glucose 4-epimerase|nr:NAD-dependent epimerase/dehydratase family protein [Bacteroidales bacterium]
MINVLITGGAGFIGSSFAEKLLKNPDLFVVVVDNLSTGSINKLPQNNLDRFKFIKGNTNDYRNISEIFFGFHFDYVFHYSATVGVKRTLENPVSVLQDLKSIENILNLSKNLDVKRVFFSSSSEVYGEPVEFPQNENTTPLNSKLPYAIVKNASEAYLKSYYKEYKLPYTIFRFFNTYGPKQSKDFVISRFINMALENSPLTIYGDGKQTRTFCYIDDNVDATYNCFEQVLKNASTPSEIINIGNNNETHIEDVAKLIIELTGSSSKLNYLPPLKEGDMRRRLPDITKMQKLLNRPLLPIEEGIKKILNNTKYII